MTDRKQSAVARRLASQYSESGDTALENLQNSLNNRTSENESQIRSLLEKTTLTNTSLNDLNTQVQTQFASDIKGTLAWTLINVSALVNTLYNGTIDIDVGTGTGGNGPVSTLKSVTITVDPGLSYVVDQTISLAATDNRNAYIKGVVRSYDKLTGVLEILPKEYGTGSSSSWQLSTSPNIVKFTDLDGGFASTDINGGTAAAGGGHSIEGGGA
jgi:hypothetical protein